jgi:hypothetical protein
LNGSNCPVTALSLVFASNADTSRYTPTLQNIAIPMDFIPSTATETTKVRIHEVERQLAGIKSEVMLRRYLQHPEMHIWILVPSEADVTNLARRRSLSPPRLVPTICP